MGTCLPVATTLELDVVGATTAGLNAKLVKLVVELFSEPLVRMDRLLRIEAFELLRGTNKDGGVSGVLDRRFDFSFGEGTGATVVEMECVPNEDGFSFKVCEESA